MSIDIKALHETLGDIISRSASTDDNPNTTRKRLREVQDALKPYIPIDEPLNLGAVVRSAEGATFVRTDSSNEDLPWCLMDQGEFYDWRSVTEGGPVTVLSHGYAEQP